MKIMIVDDSITMRRIIINNLQKAGQRDIVEAVDGEEGLERLSALDGKVDLILLDWNMPNMNGLDFLKAAKANASFQRIPVVMVTTESQREQVITAIEAGASGYIIKPFTPEAFQKNILDRLKPTGA